MFGKKKKIINVGGKEIELEPKPTKVGFFSFGKPKPKAPQQPQPAQPAQATKPQAPQQPPQPAQRPPWTAPTQQPQKPIDVKPGMGMGDINIYRKQEQAAQSPQSIINQPAKPPQRPSIFQPRPKPQQPMQPTRPAQQRPQPGVPAGPTPWKLYLASVAAKHKGLEEGLRKQGIKGSAIDFVQR
ncbi:MAG: hypothetical protein KGH66_03710, partial [Candidatus Micrarchaeota archaeon]|nr:hypothetical protein [Candidatus Micrarchaeota archaeon]